MKKQDVSQLKKNLLKNGTRFIDLKYTSLTGNMHHITVPIDRYDKVVSEGVGADGSSLPGYKAVEKGDMLLLPDLDTMMFDPFFEKKTASFLCSIYSPDTLKPFERDTRHVAQRAVSFVQQELTTNAFFQPELEFYIFEDTV